MGVGAQPPMWPDGFCEQLIKHGYRVIRFDHRDTGLSTKMHGSRAKGSVYPPRVDGQCNIRASR